MIDQMMLTHKHTNNVLSLSHTNTHARTHAYIHIHTHTHTHTEFMTNVATQAYFCCFQCMLRNIVKVQNKQKRLCFNKLTVGWVEKRFFEILCQKLFQIKKKKYLFVAPFSLDDTPPPPPPTHTHTSYHSSKMSVVCV